MSKSIYIYTIITTLLKELDHFENRNLIFENFIQKSRQKAKKKKAHITHFFGENHAF